MRLFLLPISTRQSLLYCQSKPVSTTATSWTDRITTRATTTWLFWEGKPPKTWQKRVTETGNKLFQRLPYEEWGLKSIHPLATAKRKRIEEAMSEKDKDKLQEDEVAVEFPEGFVDQPHVQETLRRLGSEDKQNYHRKWLVGSILGMPISAPVALVPIIPNLPFFYLCFRAWSHWRARAGSMHLEFLNGKRLTKGTPSSLLRTAYLQATLETSSTKLDEEYQIINKGTAELPMESQDSEELVLTKDGGKFIAESLKIPALEMEIERAIWQVNRQIKARKELLKEKREIESKTKPNG